MRRLTLVLAACVPLAAASLAGGAPRQDRTASAVAATFTATTVHARATTTCSSADGTFQITKATYSGSSSGDAPLGGPIRLTVRAEINITKRVGTIDGSVVIDRQGRDAHAHLTGLYRGGNVTGLLTGQAMPRGQRLLATFTASFSSDGGFGAGGIGVGNLAPTALQLTEGSCSPAKPATGQRKLLGGEVLAVSSTSVTVALAASGTFSCALDHRARAQLAAQHVRAGDEVTAVCSFVGGKWRLLQVTKQRAQKPEHAKGKKNR